VSQQDAIARLAQLLGVAPTYANAFGQSVDVSPETIRAILAGFGLPVGSDADAHRSLEEVERLRQGLVPRVIPVEAGRPARIPVRRATGVANWRVTDEEGVVREGRAWLLDGALQLPPMLAGYHRLRVEGGGEVGEATLIAAPPQCWEPDDIAQGARLWGATAQVYGLRSPRNFGIGDYTDVARAADGAGALGASFLGLSPVHALFSADRSKISPYSPSSRLFLETIFIDPTAVPGFQGSEAERLLNVPETKERLQALRDAPLVDHQAIWELKRPLLDALWAAIRDRRPDPAFEAFRREGGQALEAHATFEALSEYFRSQGKWWLGDWPIPYRNARSQEVQLFRREFAERIGFQAWLQWLADVQLANAADAARAAGMAIGLYRDLAVGADSAGSEIWGHPERFAPTLSVGAPPDPLGPQGQKWGLPPLNPLALERQSLAAFRDLVRANMRHAGAIRIDHAFQLNRLFLIPGDAPASQGAYVGYPFEAMLAVLRLESHRNRCMIIAEDLGTAPHGFSEAIMASGLYSYRVLWFERDGGGHGGGAGFTRPADYPQKALAVFTTHDLPTFRGWWRGLDIELRQSFGIYDQESADRERAARATDKRFFTEGLVAEGLLAPTEPPETAPLEPTMRYLARTASALVAVQLEDAIGELYQANMPGPELGHPNWRRRLATDIDAITAPGGDLAKLAAAMSSEGRGERPSAGALASPPPRATYRLQFHKDFTFDDAVRIVPYLAKLGISHVYSSPIHKARPGSAHGYDIVDHAAINPELGGEDGFRRLSDALKEHGLGLILDIVPNHMGVGGADNGWWLSVIEWGELSPHARAFDIDWERMGASHKLVLPVLGDRYGDALEKGDLKLAHEPEEGGFSVSHWEHRLPISPLTYPIVLDRALVALDDLQSPGGAIVMAVSDRLRAMAEETIPERRAGFFEEAQRLKGQLAEAVAASPALKNAVDRAVTLINGSPGQPESFGTLHRILELQSYRLAHWRVAASDINYRRFFDINTLAGVRVEHPEIFEQTHRMVFRLIAEGRVQGLRIDHIDGLADPEGYVRAVQAAVGPGFYVVVEKILEPGERMRPWPVAGTTGYDVLNLIDGVFVDGSNAETFETIYRRISKLEGSYGELLRGAKAEILETSFASELEVLVSDLKRVADADRRTRDYTAYAMRRALIEVIARFPVYRSYLGDGAPTREDLVLVRDTIRRAKRSSALPDRTMHDFIAAALLGDVETEGPGRPTPDLVRRFRRRFQQLTGPVMAKSLEDTLFYRYVRLVSLNEVGGDPAQFGGSIEAFHKLNAERLVDWPHAMIASATHDTKRGEDARGRLSALSEMPDAWADALERFERLCAPYLLEVDGDEAPDGNDRYLLLQALLGAWPIELLGGETAEAVSSFRERIEGYVLKALREAKRHTSWVHGNEPYENAANALVGALLRPQSKFLAEFRPLARRVAAFGVISGLARTTLKCTLPGVPDIYQGTEFWDLSLVDPDNRRPVDYDARARALEPRAPLHRLLAEWRDGRVKQAVLTRILHDRAGSPALYAEGDYEPLHAIGARADSVIAFTRTRGDEALCVAVPRLVAGLVKNGGALEREAWGDTALPIPAGRWRNILTGIDVGVGPGGHPIGELFGGLPIAVLRART
jgi:(1->4)-alpha-D-glucan 1-alpha-D-glucosylmutase